MLAVILIVLLSVFPAQAQRLPDPAGAAQPFASREGNSPSGYYLSGGFCAPLNRDSRPAVPRPPGASCPSGWYASGSGCVRLNR
jgi:hypothetical protein